MAPHVVAVEQPGGAHGLEQAVGRAHAERGDIRHVPTIPGPLFEIETAVPHHACHGVPGGAPQQQPRAVALRRGFGDAQLHRRQLGMAETTRLAAADALDEGLDHGIQYADRRRDQGKRNRRDPGQAVDRALVDPAAGPGAGIEQLQRLDAMVGNEGPVDHDVLAAGSLQSGDVPGVDDLERVARHEEVAGCRGAAFVIGGDETLDEDPGRVVAAARELPPPGEFDPARRPLCPAGRREPRGHQRVGVLAPDLVLGLPRHHAHRHHVIAEDSEHPCRRSATAPEARHGLDYVIQAEFAAAVSCRQGCPEKA